MFNCGKFAAINLAGDNRRDRSADGDGAGFGVVHRIEVAGCGDGIRRSAFDSATLARLHPAEKPDPWGGAGVFLPVR